MREEVELKFLEIDKDEIVKKLKEAGAELQYEGGLDTLAFWGEGFDPYDSSKKFLRIRSANDKVKITYKSPEKDASRGEVEIEIDSFDNATELLTRLGFEPAERIPKYRQHWTLGNVAFEIDEMKGIPAWLEIETHSMEDMEAICEKVGINISEGREGMIMELYPDKFNTS